MIQRRPWPALVVGSVALAALALPVLGMHLAFGDAGSRPESDTTRRTYDLLSEGLGPRFNGPIPVVAETRVERPMPEPWTVSGIP